MAYGVQISAGLVLADSGRAFGATASQFGRPLALHGLDFRRFRSSLTNSSLALCRKIRARTACPQAIAACVIGGVWVLAVAARRRQLKKLFVNIFILAHPALRGG